MFEYLHLKKVRVVSKQKYPHYSIIKISAYLNDVLEVRKPRAGPKIANA